MSGCQTHRHETTAGVCRSCRGEFCADCLVYSYGTAKAPFCVRCALAAAGATAASGGPALAEPLSA